MRRDLSSCRPGGDLQVVPDARQDLLLGQLLGRPAARIPSCRPRLPLAHLRTQVRGPHRSAGSSRSSGPPAAAAATRTTGPRPGGRHLLHRGAQPSHLRQQRRQHVLVLRRRGLAAASTPISTAAPAAIPILIAAVSQCVCHLEPPRYDGIIRAADTRTYAEYADRPRRDLMNTTDSRCRAVAVALGRLDCAGAAVSIPGHEEGRPRRHLPRHQGRGSVSLARGRQVARDRGVGRGAEQGHVPLPREDSVPRAAARRASTR